MSKIKFKFLFKSGAVIDTDYIDEEHISTEFASKIFNVLSDMTADVVCVGCVSVRVDDLSAIKYIEVEE